MDATPLMTQHGIDQRQIADRLVQVRFLEDDADLLVSLRPWAQAVADDFLQDFYDYQFSYDEFRQIVERSGSSRQRLVEAQRAYLLGLFGGMPDPAYIESRLRIGAVHAKLGVTPHWYVSSYALYERYLFPRLRRHYWYRPLRARRAVAALSKLQTFDCGLVMQTYVEGVAENARTDDVARRATVESRHVRRLLGQIRPPIVRAAPKSEDDHFLNI
jgi:hypothetical protein